MLSSQTRQDVSRIHTLVEALGYGDGLSEAHRILGTDRYHVAFGRWEIEDKIITRHNEEPITVQHWNEKADGTWVRVR